MHGFAPWPARISSTFEKNKLLKQKSSKSAEIAVTFFGGRHDRLESSYLTYWNFSYDFYTFSLFFFSCFSGWISHSGITTFTPETYNAKFDKKKWKGDKNYRGSVLEAVLITKAKGMKYPASINETLAECTSV
jgi:hypothetical protein